MRTLLISQDFPPDVGGIQTYAAELARRLAPRCESFAAVVPRHASAKDHAFPFPVHRVAARPDLLPLAALPVLPVLARRMRCMVAFHAQWQTVGASVLARRLTGFPRHIVVAAHGRELLFRPPGFPKAFYRWLRYGLLRQADKLLPVSHYTAGILQELGVSSRRISIVNNGTNPERFFPEDASLLRNRLGVRGRRVLLTVGRLVPRKGIDVTLRALQRVVASVPKVTYLVAGDGPDRERLEALAERLGVASHVRFLGHISYDELRLHYNAADVFVMPARESTPDVEGFGIVFLEAGACGKPVVGARTGGIPDAIVDGETGLLVPPEDPRALADALTRLLGDAEYAKKLGQQGRTRVLQRATWRHVANTVYAALEEVEGGSSCTSS